MRPLSELDKKGEGSISTVKPKIPHGLNGNWAYNATFRCHLENAFKAVMIDCVSNLPSEAKGNRQKGVNEMVDAIQFMGLEVEDNNETTHFGNDEEEEEATEETNSCGKREKKYCKYKDREEAATLFENGRCVSGIILDDDKYGLVLKDESVVEIQHGQFSSRRWGSDYFEWRIESLASPDSFDQSRIVDYFLLLPRLGNNGFMTNATFDKTFYMITASWKELVCKKKDGIDQGVLTEPRIPEAKYDE
jgi:hypothetical protein